MAAKAKTKRNQGILQAFERGDSIYQIAKRRKLSWTRVKTIIREEMSRQAKAARP